MRSVPWSLARALITWVVLLAGCLVLAAGARAQPDRDEVPGRVGRIVQVDGRVSHYDDEQGRWSEAWRNQAITERDRLSTDPVSRLQLGIGSTEVRLSGDTEIAFERLDDARIVIRIDRGSVALRVRSRDIVRELEVRAGHTWLRPERSGHYRVDRQRDMTTVTVWRGLARVETSDQRMSVEEGRSVQLALDGRSTTLVSWGGVEQDAFSDWVARDEGQDDRQAGQGYVSPEMTGADELGRHGRWERHPEVGMVWIPLSVTIDWAPFRHGRWTWHNRWGWTWIDEEPWGFATSHYGRWLQWRGRWVWTPGVYVARPVYAPALVAWVGGHSPGVSVSIGIGAGATVGWYPLAPWDVYVPPFRHPPRYHDRVNHPHRRPGVPATVPAGPIRYGNDGLPQAVTVVPADVLRHRQPVAPAVIGRPGGPRPPGRSVAPPPHPAPPVVHVPGGAVPAPRHGDRQHGPGDRQPISPRVVPVPGGGVPAGSIGPGFPAPPAHSPAPVAPAATPPTPTRIPAAPPAATPPAPPREAAPRPPAREPSDHRPLRDPGTATSPREPATSQPRAEPPREAGRESVRERTDKRDNARERAERQ